MNLKKRAFSLGLAGALGGFTALGLGAGVVHADPKFPSPPIPPIPAPPPIPKVEVPRVEVPRPPKVDVEVPRVDVDVPRVEAPRIPDVDVNVPPIDVPPLPRADLPPVAAPAVDVDLPDLEPNLPNIDAYFGLPGARIPPGQLKNAATINGVPNPFFNIPPGQLKKMRTVQGYENPFFDEAPGHWEIPQWAVPDVWPGVPGVGDYFGLPGEQIGPVQLRAEATINGVRNPFYGIPSDELRKLPTVQGFENPFFDGTPGHWEIP
ncbi:hypothetical protein [Mycolicibacterium novocastrense]|uniref:hypothetical protein n=1 Tax=Mycolicibacterium novocastrense TaxID=59813 RepID=UPI000B1E883C|nr:hypothetical protein [Mycolicibacterium novocastrense]